MGLENTPSDSLCLPSRLEFSWDLKNAPWIDGCGPQDEHANTVKGWSDVHDLLDNKNLNMTLLQLRETMLRSQVYKHSHNAA